MNPHFITWEIDYIDGQTLREADGVKYDQIPRGGVKAISLHSSQLHQRVLELPTQGNPHFFYRRRTQMIQGQPGPRIVYLLGIYPGFVLQFDPEVEEVTQVAVDIEPMKGESPSLS